MLSVDERWDLIDKISKKTVKFGKYKHTLKDAIGELTVKPLTGIPIAIAVLYGLWSFFGSFAGFFTDGFFVELFDEHFLPWMQANFPGEGGWFYYIFVGDPLADNCFEAFGVLTSGLFVAIGVVLPAIIAFYLILTLLEDIGYMPRLAVLIDTILHKIGLHGYAIVPTILSLGCNVPAVTASRILETRKQRFIMMTLLAIFIPCGAQLGIMKEVIPDTMGFVLIYLLIGYFILGLVLNKIVPGKSPEILIDVPPYQRPMMRNVRRKLRMRVVGFFKVAIPFVLLGVAVVNILYKGGVIDWLADALSPLLSGWFGVPNETVGPLIAAFLRKDLAVAQLSAISMTSYQMITSVVLVSIYFPCVATFAMILKEGWKELLGSVAVLGVVVFLYGGLIHLIGILLGVA
ncbi:MAG: ferrous iron transporter B [Methanomicrobia archaeon]|nr:ferrous iron transporter B [Methanomicrobia archaeon]